MSPYHALLSRVMFPSSQSVSSVGQGLCWLRVHRPHEDVVGLEWCMGMPPLVHFLDFISLLVYVSPPCASLSCHASFLAARSELGWARVVLAVRAPAACGRCGFGVVHGNAPLVHFLNFISLLVYVSPPCASLPCHASFAAARSEFGWARVVLAVRAPAACGRCGFGVVHGNAPPCALPEPYISSRLCLPTMRFSPLSCFLCRKE